MRDPDDERLADTGVSLFFPKAAAKGSFKKSAVIKDRH